MKGYNKWQKAADRAYIVVSAAFCKFGDNGRIIKRIRTMERKIL
ncbi:hypothetical protein HMPREF9429_00583 [Megasphaera micronuciformis F0359]|uniref:Uncharacterized protein n=1 Tax=Megasphaera micronuciformis F0359 TaxID=706434 RepID=E2ZAW2_9FIRM|nr:hypothetical protein HMPREF9429_00583 [Megasphaera micronuciformis F0359]